MDIIRIITGVILLVFFVVGLKRGLVRQVFEILGLIAAFIGSFYLAHHLALYIASRIELSYRIAMLIAAIVMFTGIIILFHYAGLAMQKLFKMTVLGPFDRIMGGVFGAVKGILLVSFVLVIILSLPFRWDFQDQIRDDAFTGAIYPVLPVLFDVVISRSGLDFNRVAGIEKIGSIDKVMENVEKYKEKMEEEKDELKKKAERF